MACSTGGACPASAGPGPAGSALAKQLRHPRPGALPHLRRQVGPPFVVAQRHGLLEALEHILAARTVAQVPLDRPPVGGGAARRRGSATAAPGNRRTGGRGRGWRFMTLPALRAAARAPGAAASSRWPRRCRARRPPRGWTGPRFRAARPRRGTARHRRERRLSRARRLALIACSSGPRPGSTAST